MQASLTIALLLLGVLGTGCAGYSITRDGQGDGYDVFQPEPYLLGNPIRGSDGAVKGVDFKVVWLPNYTRRYRIDTWNFLGKGHFKFTIADGWCLTGIDSETDNTAVATGLLELAKAAVARAEDAVRPDGPRLFRIGFDDAGHACRLIPVDLAPTKP